VLQLYPDEPRAKQGVEAAEKALGISSSSSAGLQHGMRRIAVVQEAECSDEEEEEEEQAAATASAAQAEPQQQLQQQLPEQLEQPQQQQRQQAEPLLDTADQVVAASPVESAAAHPAAAAAVNSPVAEPVAGSVAAADAAAASTKSGFDAADMAARITAAAEANAVADPDDDNSSSSDSNSEYESLSDSATEDDADDDLAAATGGFLLESDVVADPLAEVVVEVPLTYEQQLDQLREAGNAKFRTGGCVEMCFLRRCCRVQAVCSWLVRLLAVVACGVFGAFCSVCADAVSIDRFLCADALLCVCTRQCCKKALFLHG
jgi:hypothetical protein